MHHHLCQLHGNALGGLECSYSSLNSLRAKKSRREKGKSETCHAFTPYKEQHAEKQKDARAAAAAPIGSRRLLDWCRYYLWVLPLWIPP